MIDNLLKNFKRIKALVDIAESTQTKEYYESTELEVARTKLKITKEQSLEICFSNKRLIEKYENKEKPK